MWYLDRDPIDTLPQDGSQHRQPKRRCTKGCRAGRREDGAMKGVLEQTATRNPRVSGSAPQLRGVWPRTGQWAV